MKQDLHLLLGVVMSLIILGPTAVMAGALVSQLVTVWLP